MTGVKACYYGLNPSCTKELRGPDSKVCVECIASTITNILRVTYVPSNNVEVDKIAKQLLQR
jgi:hypothetical protein